MTNTEIRFFYYRPKKEVDKIKKSIMLQIYENGKPLDITIHPQHVSADHPHELYHNFESHDSRFIGVGLKYRIMDEDE